MSGETPVRWRVRFFGRVQHVGFRYTAFYLARGLRLTGWVDNREDGSVELEAQGQLSALRQLVIRLRGKPPIRVDHMEVQELSPVPNESKFEVILNSN
ncbi:MAG: acylphosphatase [Oscillospiraceae bacterium]|nr:acylphosphatase [Oscillospiraceae bacterium]